MITPLGVYRLCCRKSWLGSNAQFVKIKEN